MLKLSALVALALLWIPAASLAERPPGGRLEDGRAYRTDDQGFRLIDEMAELEAQVRELEAEVGALEAKLEEQDRLPGGRAQARLPRAAVPGTSSCSAEVEPLLQRLAAAEAEIQRQPDATSCERYARPLREQIALLESDRGSDEVLARERARAAELQEALDKLGQDYDRQSRMLDEGQRTAQVASADVERARSGTRVTANADVAAAARRTSQQAVEPNAALKPARADVQKDLKDVQALVLKRKDLYDTLRAKNRSVTVSLQPLNTKSGTSLDALRAKATSSQSAEELAMIHSGVKEIRGIVNDDIATLKRVGKL